ncbi:MAG TPA: SDR family NAD(P)-dependent oxidoreductase [Acidobacteriota bacterium]|nr:SDR family NAD(P)-dependent oxidoreductase [Acidobacteriota bacterium]
MGEMLRGRVAVVTGAGNGLGRAHAICFAAQGARVVVNDLGTSHDGHGASHAEADAVVEQIRKAGGVAVANYASVAVEDGAKSIIQQAVDEFGRIDILVNNAGIIRHQDIDAIRTEDWDLTIKTHLYGMMFCTRAATAHMKKQHYGRILCTSSHIGLGFPGQASYSTVKEGIVGFARTVAREMAPYGTTCNVLRPIAVWRGPGPKIINPIYEANQPEDVAALATYLVSEAADPINGCIFEVFHGHVGLFVEPQPIEKVIKKDGTWTAEELAEVIPVQLTAGRSRESFPFTLPDIFKLPPKE